MRMIKEGQKRFPIFERLDGSWSKNPPTPEEAATYNCTLYEPFPSERCTCGRKVIHFTNSDAVGNYCCTVDKAAEEYNRAIVAGGPSSAAAARVLGLDHFFTHKSCEVCGALCKRTLNGRCFFCTGTSPRQAAVSAGKIWYTPTEPCKKCGQIAEKRVNNGECKGCTSKLAPKLVPIRRQWPDMIISHKDAAAAGMNTYRTGKPCARGHTGWRWVSTRGCLTCQGRD